MAGAHPEQHGRGPAPFAGQNVVISYLGSDGGYFVGRQSPEMAAQAQERFESPEYIVEHGPGEVRVMDFGEDSTLAAAALYDEQNRISDRAIALSKKGSHGGY